MNILPKKSWHVRNWRNIERVKKDEQKAAEEERERERKVALAESETRTTYLRNKARRQNKTDTIAHPSNTPGHINFFQDEEEGKITGGFNKEHEQEKTEEKEKQEKAIGLLTYLGQSAVETQNEKPWYYKPRKRSRRDSSEDDEIMKKRREECHKKKKLAHDPLQQMDSYIRQKQKVDKQREGKHREHKDKNDKHHYRKDKSKVYGKKTMEEMRAERHRREQREREKAHRLISRMSGETTTTKTHPVVTDERQMRYNSQFNPDFVRNRK